jgi:hypothetical protein
MTLRFPGGSDGGAETLPPSGSEAKSGESTPESFRVVKEVDAVR